MAAGRSFADYVKRKCYNGLFSAAEDYIRENADSMDFRSSRVHRAGVLELQDATIERVYVSDLPGMKVAFDVGLELEVLIKEDDYHYDETDVKYPWIRISCEGDLSKALDDWRITNVEPFDKKNAPFNSLSDALVPYIKHDDLEKAATLFLKEFYPEALEITKRGTPPVWVDPKVLAERLGLKIMSQRIREDASVFGQLYFVDTDAEMFDANAGESKMVHIDGQTIVVDPRNFLLRSLGSYNNTIIHECVHWAKHRKVFELEKLFNDEASCISCEVVGGAASSVSQKATEMMERQANQLAPRIQMPAGPFKAKANEYITKFMRETNARHEVDVMEMVITELETVFGVSKQAAKIRLVELGFESAIGTYTFLDGHYVKPHAFRRGSLKVNQTFSISAQDAGIERILNRELNELTKTGDYLFIDNHYVYNAPLYVDRHENGQLIMTEYARTHMDECCLVFDMKVTSRHCADYHTACFLNREQSDITFKLEFHNGYQNSPQERQVAMRQKQLEEEISIRKQMTDDPEQCMDLLLKWRGVKYTELADMIEMNDRTIRRTVKGETEPKVETAFLICIALHLSPVISEKLMEVLGCKLKPFDTKHQWLNEALHTKYPETPEAVQEYLLPYGINLGITIF